MTSHLNPFSVLPLCTVESEELQLQNKKKEFPRMVTASVLMNCIEFCDDSKNVIRRVTIKEPETVELPEPKKAEKTWYDSDDDDSYYAKDTPVVNQEATPKLGVIPSENKTRWAVFRYGGNILKVYDSTRDKVTSIKYEDRFISISISDMYLAVCYHFSVLVYRIDGEYPERIQEVSFFNRGIPSRVYLFGNRCVVATTRTVSEKNAFVVTEMAIVDQDQDEDEEDETDNYEMSTLFNRFGKFISFDMYESDRATTMALLYFDHNDTPRLLVNRFVSGNARGSYLTESYEIRHFLYAYSEIKEFITVDFTDSDDKLVITAIYKGKKDTLEVSLEDSFTTSLKLKPTSNPKEPEKETSDVAALTDSKTFIEPKAKDEDDTEVESEAEAESENSTESGKSPESTLGMDNKDSEIRDEAVVENKDEQSDDSDSVMEEDDDGLWNMFVCMCFVVIVGWCVVWSTGNYGVQYDMCPVWNPFMGGTLPISEWQWPTCPI